MGSTYIKRADNQFQHFGGLGNVRAALAPATDSAARGLPNFKFGMEEAPTSPVHLFLLFKDMRQSLEAAE